MKIWRAGDEKLLSAIRSRKPPKLGREAAIDVPIMVEILASERAPEIGPFADVLVSGGEKIGLQLRVLTPAEVAILSAQLRGAGIGNVAAVLANTDLRARIFAGRPLPPLEEILKHLATVVAHVEAAASAGQGLIVDLRG